MSKSETVALVLGHAGGKIGAYDGMINATVEAKKGDKDSAISATVNAVGSGATMFPGKYPGPIGGLVVTVGMLQKSGMDASKFTVADVLALGGAVAALFGAPVIGFGFAVAGIGWTLYTLNDPLRDKTISDFYRSAKDWQPPRDPIILDLDGNGLQTVGLASNIYFDHNGDGILSKTGWVGEGDALLIWDRNSNGLIDNGAELFGDFTPMPDGSLAPNGFAALAALDANGDGILDASDPAFAELKLWVDSDQNAVTGEGELISLTDAGIASLNLGSTLKNQKQSNGNTLAREGSFTRTGGTESAMGEFHLAIDTFDTQFAEQIEVPEELRGLPMMNGSGNVRDLQQAATQSSNLQGLLNQFESSADRFGQHKNWSLCT
ncbi:MAG: hypothetical protein GXZ05_07260 [Gammaproteobacteria bacterium]|nr:hypothetical protein [Gammaproteobacteria bacterium]